MSRHEGIEAEYLKMLRHEGRGPKSVASLCEAAEVSERDFFSCYPTLESVEKRFWRGKVDEVIGGLKGGEEFHGFSAREKLLAFYFAFLEDSLSYRSLLLLRVNRPPEMPHPAMKGLGEGFEEFAEELIAEGVESGEIPRRGPLNRAYKKGFWLNFLSVIHFHLKDESEGYERTDAFVEKSVALMFDLIGRQPLDSALDLGRFLLPSQIQRS